MLGPMFQTPLKCGADISLCSLSKYVGGHSDLVGGSIRGHDKIGATAYANLDKKGTLDPKTTLVLCGLAEN